MNGVQEENQNMSKTFTVPFDFGDDIYIIYPCGPTVFCFKDKIQQICFSSRNISIKCRDNKDFNKTYVLGKRAFLTTEEAITAKEKLQAEIDSRRNKS